MDRKILEQITFQRLGYVGCSSQNQIDKIVARCFENPVSHPHSYEETGMCTECDAAWVVDRYKEIFDGDN